MENVVEILKSFQDLSAWKVTTNQTESSELFYVGDKLETNRVEDIISLTVTVYVDKDDLRGSSTFKVYSYMTKEDIISEIKNAMSNSVFALNKFYELPSPIKEENKQENECSFKNRPLKDVAKDVQEAVFRAKRKKQATLNATEIFVYKITSNIKNSNGIDVTSTSYKINIELIPTWTDEKESVEIYEMLKYGDLDQDLITKEVEETLLLVEARSAAKKIQLPEDIDVIIEGSENIPQIVSYFTYDLSYQSVYQKTNRSPVGESSQGKEIQGDKISIELVPYYKGAMNSSYVDYDGVILHPIHLIEDGINKNYYGSYRYGYYLGIKEPTGILPITVLKNGSLSNEDIHSKPYIRCVKFSSIQMESSSGFFGGEVRLGFYYDGEKEIPITGFSISGNMHEAKSTLRLSKEEVTYPSYHGPKYLVFKGIKIL